MVSGSAHSDLDRCRAEIAALRDHAAREPERWPAYLFVLGEMDWIREMDMIEAEKTDTHHRCELSARGRA